MSNKLEKVQKQLELNSIAYKETIKNAKNLIAEKIKNYYGDKYNVYSLSSRNLIIKVNGANDCFGIEIAHGDEKIYGKDEFEFSIGVGSVGTFNIFDKDNPRYKYYKMVNDIIYNEQLMKDVYDILKKMSTVIEPLQEESHKLYSECKKLESEEYINNTNKENNTQREKDAKNFEKNNWVVCYRKSNGPWKYRGIPVYIQSFYTNEIDANNDKYMYNKRSANKVYYSCNVNKLKINEL